MSNIDPVAGHLTVPKALQSTPVYRRVQSKLRRQTVRRRLVRASLLGFNTLLLVGIIGFVFESQHHAEGASRSLATVTADVNATNPLDQLSSADIALTVARLDNLPETDPVTNQADSQATELASATVTNNVIAKPQVVATALKSKADIKTYVSVEGDTASSLAVKFGVTSDSIRWSNPGMSVGVIPAGTKLVIPPVNGIVYTVKSGDTPATLSQKYGANQDQIVAYNDAEISGLKEGEQIIIPGAIQPVVKPTVTRSSSWGGSATYGAANGYAYGYCTWWVANQRAAAGRPLPTNLGNASTWAVRAAAYGLSVGRTPAVGAAVVTSTRGEGHVAYVTAVYDDGSIEISEMNHLGWNRTDTRVISGSFSYIY